MEFGAKSTTIIAEKRDLRHESGMTMKNEKRTSKKRGIY